MSEQPGEYRVGEGQFSEAELREAVGWVTERSPDWSGRNEEAVQRLGWAITELATLRTESGVVLARLDQKDQAINELAHELRGQLGELVLLAGGIAHYLEREQFEKAREKARELEQRLKARDAVIVAGRDRALGV